MSRDIEITFDLTKLKRDLALVARTIPREAKPALRRAVDRSVKGLRTPLGRRLRQDTTLAGPSVTRALRAARTTVSGDEARGELRVASRRLPLAAYRIAPRRPTVQRGKSPEQRKPLRYQLRSAGKTYGDVSRQGGGSPLFAVRLRSGKLAVFSRVGRDLRPEYAPAVQFHVAAPEFAASQEDFLRERFMRELDHELSFRLNRAGGGR